MCYYESISKCEEMILNLYFSTSNNSLNVAKYYENHLAVHNQIVKTFDLTSFAQREEFNYAQTAEIAIISFPVYSQNIPKPFKEVLKKLNAKYIVLNATYGGMSFGNVLFEAQKIIKGKIIGAGYLCSNHIYYDLKIHQKLEVLDPIINKIINIESITQPSIIIPRYPKQLFASFVPNLRSKIAVKIHRTNNCTNCNLCQQSCPVQAITNGQINTNCIRCLNCVNKCPHQALNVTYLKILKKYLRKVRITDNLVFY